MDMHTVTINSVGIGMASRRLLGCIAAVCAVVASGCATTGPQGGGRGDKEIVAERAQKRWDALVRNDFGEAYKYISPAGRAVIKQDAYAAQFKPGFWKGATVENVECTAPDVCNVDVRIAYEYGGFNMKAPVHEKWNKQNSTWWFVLER